MIELARHIEILLLDNDCVILPGFGGFVAHHTPATWSKEEKIFLPPSRNIGFNPYLKMNDGLLVQSYMEVYNTNFSDATKYVEKEIDRMVSILHEDGKIELPNVGEIRYSIHETYEFIPYNNKITSPSLYGLASFEIRELKDIRQTEVVAVQPAQLTETPVRKEKKTYQININRAYLRNTAAAVAAIALFFFMSTPVENTYIENENYARILPAELFERIEKQSVITTPVHVTGGKASIQPDNNVSYSNHNPLTAVNNEVAADYPYHIIVGSMNSSREAGAMINQLKMQGYKNAKTLIDDGKIRISIMTCPTREKAYQEIETLRNTTQYNAWLLTR